MARKTFEETVAFHKALSQARDMLMTGPRATPPRFKAIKKAARRLIRNKPITGSWRSWPKEKTIA